MRHRAFPLGDAGAGLADRLRPAAAVGGIVLVFVVAGWWLLRPATPPVEASLPRSPSVPAAEAPGGSSSVVPSAPSSTTTTVPELIVHAAGAVAHPGVYRLAPGARVVDLVEAAGGLAGAADRPRINLAAPLVDGERVWLPARGELAAPEVIAGEGGGSSPVGGPGPGATASVVPTSPSSPVDLNAATAEQLDSLPGIGPATAAAILAQRQVVGRFGSVDELLDVRGIGDAKLEQLRPLVTV